MCVCNSLSHYIRYQLQILLVFESVCYCIPLTDYAILSNMVQEMI